MGGRRLCGAARLYRRRENLRKPAADRPLLWGDQSAFCCRFIGTMGGGLDISAAGPTDLAETDPVKSLALDANYP